VSGLGFQSFFAVLVVLALVAALAWLLRRGAFKALGQGNRAMTVETALPIGERRSLIIVAVEGRRLLLGLTPGQISMVTELAPAAPAATPQGGDESRPATFEQQLLAKAKDAMSRLREARHAQVQVAVDAADARVVGYGDILQLSA
jgi:flagellar protein FliO/FliZ